MSIFRGARASARLLHEDDGLVTLEWVALATAVIGIGVITIIKPSVNSAASTVGSNLLSSVNSNS
jgi:hypothetical protein